MFAIEPPQQQDAPSLIEATRRYLVPTVVLTVIGLLIGVFLTLAGGGNTTAVGRLSLTDPRGNAVFKSGSGVNIDLARYAEDRADFANSTAVFELAAEELNSNVSATDLRKKCETTGEVDSNVLTITCSFPDESTALDAVDAISSAYTTQARQQTKDAETVTLAALETERVAIDTLIEQARADAVAGSEIDAALAISIADRKTNVEQEASSIRTRAAQFGAGTEFYDPARVPNSTSPVVTLIRNGIVGALLGGLVAVAIAWFRADRSPVVERGSDVAESLGLPFLGEIRNSGSSSGPLDFTASPEEQFRLVASNLDAVLDGGLALFTSPTPIENHAEVVINLALVATHSGKRVLLIDADTHRRSVSNALGTSNAAGFCELLTGAKSPSDVTSRIQLDTTPGLDNLQLFLIGPGTAPSDVGALYRSPRTQQGLEYLRTKFDLVIIDCPPMLSSAETVSLARAGGGMMMLVQPGTPKAAIENVKRQLSFVRADGVGFVMVDDAK